jgi:hypothetical protein
MRGMVSTINNQAARASGGGATRKEFNAIRV